MKALAKTFWAVLTLSTCVGVCLALPTPREVPLCVLERSATRGEHRNVQVSGIYSDGIDMGVLTDPACPTLYTWVELDLSSPANKEALRTIIGTSGSAKVVFDGEFYGPRIPDPKLPEAIKKSYKPGWGHLGAFPTKLAVHAIKSVEPTRDHLPQSAKGTPAIGIPLWIQSGSQPVYPLIAQVAEIEGVVHLKATVLDGRVTRVEVEQTTSQSARRWLAPSARSLLLSWQFSKTASGTLPVEFRYVSTPPGTGSEVDTRMVPSKGIIVVLKGERPKPKVMYSNGPKQRARFRR